MDDMTTFEIPGLDKVYADIDSAIYAYKSAVSGGAGVSGARERLKNILYTHQGDIVRCMKAYRDLIKYAQDCNTRANMFEEALNESDDENAKLKARVKELEESTPKKSARAKKTDA